MEVAQLKFNFKLLEDVSKLAWCAHIEQSPEPTLNAYHGSAIELFEDGFVEGAWDGNFLCLNFDQTEFFIGTGAKLTEQGHLLFATPSHPLERIYLIREAHHLYLANSLPLLLALSQHQLDLSYRHYEHDLASILWGLEHYIKAIPLKGNFQLELHYYCNLLINPHTLKITPQEKIPIKPFSDFNDYRKRITAMLLKLKRNAEDHHRNHIRYGMVTTISSGYDAACCSALAKELGCDTALTFNEPASYLKDSGHEVAAFLGYSNIISKNADDYLTNDEYLEAEFVSSGELGTNIVFTAFENEFEDNIAIIGDRGDYMWGKYDKVNNDFIFEDNIYPSTSMIEHRLRIGYLLLPLPLYGAEQWESIRKITLSEEMKPYEVGGYYCRPIARRIVEEAGVPREKFGQNKLGVGINYHYDNLNRLRKRMSDRSFQSYLAYFSSHKHHWTTNLYPWLKFVWSSRNAYYDFAVRKIMPNKTIFFSSQFVSSPGASSFLFHWGVEMMTQRTQTQLQSSLEKRGVL